MKPALLMKGGLFIFVEEERAFQFLGPTVRSGPDASLVRTWPRNYQQPAPAYPN
jgi:hypothetical protein